MPAKPVAGAVGSCAEPQPLGAVAGAAMGSGQRHRVWGDLPRLRLETVSLVAELGISVERLAGCRLGASSIEFPPFGVRMP